MVRASLEELRLDYKDFLRQRGLPLWERSDSRRQALIDRRCTTADEVAAWLRDCRQGGHHGQAAYSEISANAVLVLINVACALLNRQIKTLAENFENEGGFTERMYLVRSARRNNSSNKSI